MSETIDAGTMLDLVLVYCPLGNTTMLVQAPAWSGLEPDDAVVLSDESPANVLSCITICKEETAYGFILGIALGGRDIDTPLKRIKCKVRYEEFHYTDEQEATDG